MGDPSHRFADTPPEAPAFSIGIAILLIVFLPLLLLGAMLSSAGWDA